MNFLRRLFARAEKERPAATGDPVRIAEVEGVLAELRPYFLADGGDIHVLGIEPDGTVRLQLEGACSSCGVRETTIHQGIEPALRDRFAWVTQIVAS